jgi:hypothetical protein
LHLIIANSSREEYPTASSRIHTIIMAVFGEIQEEIINTNSVTNIIDLFRDSLPKDVTFVEYISSAASDEGKHFILDKEVF